MAKGISIHIGLNSVDPLAYGGWNGQLMACEADARDMKSLADIAGFSSTLILTASATASEIIGDVDEASKKLESGDMLFLTYSGHGGQVPDISQDEDDGLDETWVLYDRQLLDDELYHLFSKFKPGVRICMLSDSCHSGTVAKVMRSIGFELDENSSRCSYREKVVPTQHAFQNFKNNLDTYETIRSSVPHFRLSDIQASVLLVSGCQDWQLSLDGVRNGLFTEHLLRTWNDGRFTGNYREFHRSISSGMPATQQPNLFVVGDKTSEFIEEMVLEI